MVKRNGPDVVAHRGDSWSQPENTVAAIAAAVAAGVDAVEIDVRVTADGVPVLLHDATLGRCWGVDRRVADLTAAEVAAIRRGGHGIPTLVEALDLFVGSEVRVMVDLPDDRQIPAVVAICRAHAAAGQVVWSGDPAALRQVVQLWPEAVAYVSPGVELPAAMINVDATEITAADIAELHAAGQRVSVWTVDDVPTMRQLITAGADSITTNRIDLLLAVRDERPVPRSGSATAPIADLQRFLAVAEELGRAAIRAQRSAGDFTIDTKANPGDLVTDVDRGVEMTVRRVIGEEFSDHVVAGEEYGGSADAAEAEWAWYCDPVDGTSNFANGLRWSSFSLCLAHRGELVVAVVADPWRNEVTSAVRGGGAFRAGLPLTVPPRDSLAGCIVLTELAGTKGWQGLADVIAGLAAAHSAARIMGSGTLALMQPATSRVSATLINDYHVIDHGASLLICAEAGADTLAWDGSPFPLTAAGQPGGVLTAAPGVAASLVPLLPHRSTAG